jgi:uncharacterized protein (TIGR03086 family)
MGTPVTALDVTEVYRRAADEFTRRAHLVGDRWQAPTPCAGWDARRLVHHLVEEQRWTPPLLAGATIASVRDRLAGDLLGDDPMASLDAAAAAAWTAVRAEGAMARIVHLSFGDVPGAEYTWQLAADHLVHAWDLARALGADETLDPAAIVAVRDWFTGWENGYRAAGVIGPRAAVPPGAGVQAELLAMFGRDPEGTR